jgi:flagellar protein FliS
LRLKLLPELPPYYFFRFFFKISFDNKKSLPIKKGVSVFRDEDRKFRLLNREGVILAYTNGLSAYRETRVKTASQGQLIIMLYDEAIKTLDRGLELLGANGSKKDPGKIEDINKCILKAQEIITELTVSLDFEQGGDIAKNLFALYTWFNKELLEANINRNTQQITVIRNMINELRDAWSEIVSRNPAETSYKEVNGVNIAG